MRGLARDGSVAHFVPVSGCPSCFFERPVISLSWTGHLNTAKGLLWKPAPHPARGPGCGIRSLDCFSSRSRRVHSPKPAPVARAPLTRGRGLLDEQELKRWGDRFSRPLRFGSALDGSLLT